MITLANLELMEIFVKSLEGSHVPSTPPESPPHKDTSRVTPSSLEKEYVQLLIVSTGNLILGLSYPNQLNDMLSYLVNRLYDVEKKRPILECIHALLSTRMSLLDVPSPTSLATTGGGKTGRKSASSPSLPLTVSHAPVSFELLIPVLKFYNDMHVSTRVLVYKILDTALKLDYKMTHSYPTEADTSFSDRLKSSMADRLLSPSALPVDFVIAGSLLPLLGHVFGGSEIARVVDFIFYLQSELLAGENEKCSATTSSDFGARQRALGNLTVLALKELGTLLELEDLVKYVKGVQETREVGKEWEPRLDWTLEAFTVPSKKGGEGGQALPLLIEELEGVSWR